MNKFVRVAQTSQSLSIAAMEEASRLGLRVADLEHLFLALVVSDQSAGRALRSLGITLDTARSAVEQQHSSQLASLGIDASFPEAGTIVFHETTGYEWSPRAMDLISHAGSKKKTGDAAAVLRDLVAEPSGLITHILDRLQITPEALIEELDDIEQQESIELATVRSHGSATPARETGHVSASRETFVPAVITDVWDFLADPSRLPEWEVSIGSLENTPQSTLTQATAGMTWQGYARTQYPNGKQVKIKPAFQRRTAELIELRRPERIIWRFIYPDAPHRYPIVSELTLTSVTGGTHVRITNSWPRQRGWRRIVGLPLHPLRAFIIWISMFQTGSAISRAFR